MKLLIIIPAFNESKVIFNVLKKIPKHFKGVSKIDIVVIDDGSTDTTQKEAERASVTVVQHVLNRGLGAAIKTGLNFARKINVDIAVTFDGDGQHNPRDIQKIISPLLSHKADVVVGSRFKKKQNIPVDRFIINWVANLLVFAISGVFSTDTQSGLRGFSKKAINSINYKADRMEFSSEIFLEVQKHNLKLTEVPINAIYTEYSRLKGQKNTNAIPTFSRLALKFLR